MAGDDNVFEVFSTQYKDGLSGYKVSSNQPSPWHSSGGMVSYKGKYMLLTTSKPIARPGDKYKIRRSDIARDYHEDDEEIKGGKRQVSVPNADNGSKSNSSDGPAFLVASDSLLPSPLPVMGSQKLIGSGKVIVRVSQLDYALIEMAGLNCTEISSVIALDDGNKVVRHRNKRMQVKAVTPSGGYIQGTRMPKLWTVRLPSSNEDLQVYAARFGGSLGPGFTGSWVLDVKSNKLLGHIITIGFYKGSEVALIVPAMNVFKHACNELDPPKENDQGGRSVWRKFLEWIHVPKDKRRRHVV